MKRVAMFFFLVACNLCFAGEDTNIIAASDWSKPVSTAQSQSLRARMVVMYGRGACFEGPQPETQFYLELRNSSCAGVPMRIYFDPSHQLRCELLNDSGKSMPTGKPGPGAIREGSGDWITLPYDSTMRLRVNSGGYGYKKGDGLNLYLGPSGAWELRVGDTNNYYLTGTLTVTNHLPEVFPSAATPEASRLRESEWSGTIELPKLKITVPKP